MPGVQKKEGIPKIGQAPKYVEIRTKWLIQAKETRSNLANTSSTTSKQ